VRAIVRRLTFIVLLTCVRTQNVSAQTHDAAPDTVQAQDAARDTVPLLDAPPGTESLPRSEEAEEASGRRSYWIPTLELPAFLALLNGAGRTLYPNEVRDGKRVFSSTWETTRDHLQEQDWSRDENPFNINQFAHPYQGAIMYNIPRSTGLGFWPSLLYSNVGSFLWEMAGETTPPSTNDIITTGQAGSMLGEALYRIAATVRPEGTDHTSRWRGLLADLIDPPRGLNRHVFGDHYRTGLSETPPALSWQLGVGVTKDALAHDYNNPGRLLQRDATVEYSMTYGIPGKPGYGFRQPFSYFDFHVSVLFDRASPIESVMLRGLLLSTKSSSHGVWGVYGIYDYISPYLFRVSNTALSFGTTRAHWIVHAVAFQTSILGGVGFGAAGTTAGIASTPTSEALRDYHFGVTPQALAAVRLIVVDRMMLDGTARGYYVSGLGSDDRHGSEALFRGNAGIILRLIGGHSIGARFSASTRNAKYGTLPDRKFSEQTWTVGYSFVGSGRLSGGKWQ
jgi:hypothetical protein